MLLLDWCLFLSCGCACTVGGEFLKNHGVRVNLDEAVDIVDLLEWCDSILSLEVSCSVVSASGLLQKLLD